MTDYRTIASYLRECARMSKGGADEFRQLLKNQFWTEADSATTREYLDQMITNTETLLAELREARAVVDIEEKRDAA